MSRRSRVLYILLGVGIVTLVVGLALLFTYGG
jgi:flagellar basal body-associated protein FliL